MIIVRRLLHEISSCPHNCKSEHRKPVSIANHNKNSHQPHYPVVIEHAIAGKGLKPFKTNECKGFLWSHQRTSDPTGIDRPETLHGNQKPENYPKQN